MRRKRGIGQIPPEIPVIGYSNGFKKQKGAEGDQGTPLANGPRGTPKARLGDVIRKIKQYGCGSADGQTEPRESWLPETRGGRREGRGVIATFLKRKLNGHGTGSEGRK
jgi:hypothetical protein